MGTKKADNQWLFAFFVQLYVFLEMQSTGIVIGCHRLPIAE